MDVNAEPRVAIPRMRSAPQAPPGPAQVSDAHLAPAAAERAPTRRALVDAATVAAVVVVSVAAVTVGAPLPRASVLLWIPPLVAAAVIVRVGSRCRAARPGASRTTRTVLIGSAAEIQAGVGAVGGLDEPVAQVVGACLTGAVDGSLKVGHEVSTGLAELAAMIARTGAHTVTVLPGAGLSEEELRRLVWQAEAAGTRVRLWLGRCGVSAARMTVRATTAGVALDVRAPRRNGPLRLIKVGMDRLGAGLGLLMLSPLLLVLAGLILAGDGASPIFRQRRIGRAGREFVMYKFRTMVPDAESRKADLAQANERDEVLFKMAQDPRVTRVGRHLRRFSIDELPQLWNVVRGDMSLVGPRPPLAEEVERYDADMHRRLLVRPGLTGLWQVSGRSDLSWEDSRRLDLSYVDDWSPTMDLAILARTAGAVIGGSGAY